MLDLKSISKTFNAGTVNEKTALNNLCLHLNDGDFVTVIGGNGAGKSTMLNAVAGVWPVDEGTIEIGGVNVTKLPEYKRAKYLGRVFQDPMTGTAASMQIEENMALAARRGLSRTLKKGISSKEREFYRERLAELGLGLEDDVTLPMVIINDGRVIHRNLTACGRDENWLRKQLSREKASSPREIFLLTLDEQGQVFCVRKERES